MDDALDASILAERAALRRKKASAANSRQWSRQGQETRNEYDTAPSAMSHEVQDAVVSLHRQGRSRAKILGELRTTHPELSEYHVKRIIRVFRNDPKAFKDSLTDDILIWR